MDTGNGNQELGCELDMGAMGSLLFGVDVQHGVEVCVCVGGGGGFSRSTCVENAKTLVSGRNHLGLPEKSGMTPIPPVLQKWAKCKFLWLQLVAAQELQWYQGPTSHRP